MTRTVKKVKKYMRCRVLATALLLSPAVMAHAGMSNGYLCASNEPYDRFELVDNGARSALAFRLPGKHTVLPLQGHVLSGQSPQLVERNGMIVVPLTSSNARVVDIYFRLRRVMRFPGSLYGADIGGKDGEIALVTITQPGTTGPDDDRANMIQRVIDAQGHVLSARQFTMRLNEDAPTFQLTERGDGLYSLPSQHFTHASFQVLDIRSFQPQLTIEMPEMHIGDVHMISTDKGFIIINGRIFRVDGTKNVKLSPMMPLKGGFRATSIDYDPRADRMLVQADNGYAVFNGDGEMLLQQRGPFSAKLTIEGDVVERSGRTKQVRLWRYESDQGGYTEPIDLPWGSGLNWNAVACMTNSTAAFIGQDSSGANGRLVRLVD